MVEEHPIAFQCEDEGWGQYYKNAAVKYRIASFARTLITAVGKMGSKSEYTTIEPLRCSGWVTFENENIVCLYKGVLKRILIKTDFYRTAIIINKLCR